MKKILQAVIRFLKWVKHWLYDVPTSEPPKQEQYKLKATDVAKEYMVLVYHGQRINILKAAYPVWKASSRHDKRATMLKFQKQERDGVIKFVEVEGHLICVANRDYARRAEKAREAK
jgi:hypothetical protein